jgi:hypothetical protein
MRYPYILRIQFDISKRKRGVLTYSFEKPEHRLKALEALKQGSNLRFPSYTLIDERQDK